MTQNLVPEQVRALSRQKAAQFSKLLKGTSRQSVKFEAGQIWTTYNAFKLNEIVYKTSEPRIVVIIAIRKTHLVVAPISLEISMATQHDFIVKSGDCSLNFEFMIEVWNSTPALRDQLKTYIEKLSAETLNKMLALYIAYLTRDEISDELKKSVGIPLVHKDDLRTEFRSKEVDAMLYLAEPATIASIPEVSDQKSPQGLVVQLQHVFDELSKHLHVQKPDIAYAASSQKLETPKDIYRVQTGEYFITSTLRVNRSKEAFLTIHEASENVVGQKVIIRITPTYGEAHIKEISSLQIAADEADEIFVTQGLRIEEISSIEVEIG